MGRILFARVARGNPEFRDTGGGVVLISYKRQGAGLCLRWHPSARGCWGGPTRGPDGAAMSAAVGPAPRP
jgi:hypothetical protein